MASVTLSVSEEFKAEIKEFPWVNWSELSREEFLKKTIFEKYMKKEKISEAEWEFCDKIDWHPVDELPLKPEFVKKLENARKEKSIKLKSVSDIFN